MTALYGLRCNGRGHAGGKALVAMNWDWSAPLHPWASLLRLDMKGSPRVLTYHYPGLWAGAGINEHGLAFMWMGAGYMPQLNPRVGLPTYVVIAEILRRRSVPAVLRWLDSVQHAGCFIFFIGDEKGRIAVIEGMPACLAVDRSAQALTRANHYECGNIVKAAKQSILTDRDGPGPWLHQYPYGTSRFTSGGMTVDSLLAVSEDRALFTCRGGREPGPWQRGKV